MHLNPARAKVLAQEKALREYAWSSYTEYLKPATGRWPCLGVERLAGEMCLAKDLVAGTRRFVRQMEHRRRQASGAKATTERVVRAALARLGWTQADLGQRREGDPGKLGIAWRRRQETTMTVARVTQRLRLGVWTHVSNLRGAAPGPAVKPPPWRPQCQR